MVSKEDLVGAKELAELHYGRRVTQKEILSFVQPKKTVTIFDGHYLAISRRKKKKLEFASLEGSFDTKQKAVDHLVKIFNLNFQPLVVKRLTSSLVARVPYQGIVEIVYCDCTDGKHEDELK